MNKCILTIFLALMCIKVESARILGVYPFPSLSHQVVFRALTQELVKRGHDVVVITTDPIYRNKTSPKNLREIDIGFSYKMMLDRNNTLWKEVKRGVILPVRCWIYQEPNPFVTGQLDILETEEIKEFINNKNEKFDLVIFEPFIFMPLIFSEIFNAPAIMFTSLAGTPNNFEKVGAISTHPILYPSIHRTKYRNLSVFQKISEIYEEYQFHIMHEKFEKNVDDYIKKKFGPGAATVQQMQKNIVLFLSNSHPIFDGNRPVPPGVVYLGRMQLQPVKELPQDLKSYLDSSKRGVIYVSLGTNVRPSMMDPEMLNAFLKAFEALPYDILWKFDGDNLKNVSKNVKIQKWFPQRDLLGHPNIKLFITQCGLQSTDEAIDAGVPLVGIPILGDQWYNANKYVELGIGVEIDAYTITAADLINAVNKVLNDESYRTNIRQLNEIIKDQKETPIERAVWWTEHVLRHKGSRHLLSRAADMSWSEYLMADVVITIAIIVLILGILISFVFYRIITIVKYIRIVVKHKKD